MDIDIPLEHCVSEMALAGLERCGGGRNDPTDPKVLNPPVANVPLITRNVDTLRPESVFAIESVPAGRDGVPAAAVLADRADRLQRRELPARGRRNAH